MMIFTNYANYHFWAGEKIRELLYDISDEEFSQELEDYFSYNSLRKATVHTLLALEFCLAIIEEIDEDFFNTEVSRIFELPKNELLMRWKETDEKYAQLLQSKIEGTITIPPFLGRKFTISKLDFLLQYISHTTFHRGQIIILFKRLGKKVTGTDYLHYLFEIADKK